jgi:hypothetical protein
VLVLALQTAGEVARARYFGGMRLIGFLLVIFLIAGIALLVKKLIK